MNSDIFIPSMLNTNQTYPLIPNSQEYVYYKKYVSIHSEDRDILKYPNPSLFDIELPEDILNIMSVKLVDWVFPLSYYVFSEKYFNLTMTFKITNPYNPGENYLADELQQNIFEALYENQYNDYVITIQDGNYTPQRMAAELTNKFNEVVSNYIISYFETNGYNSSLAEFISKGGYSQFVIVYNEVSKKLWFGNKSSEFEITNESQILVNLLLNKATYCSKFPVPDYINWGLPSYLGFSRSNIKSLSLNSSITTINGNVPRFYYGDVVSGDDGYWLLPDTELLGAKVSFMETPYNLNLYLPLELYMEIEGLNCEDETMPFNVSKFTLTTNNTNGIVNSYFGRMKFNENDNCKNVTGYKLFYPPAERVRKLQIKLRFHNGYLVDLNNLNYSFRLEFTLYNPQILRKYNLFQPQLGKPI